MTMKILNLLQPLRDEENDVTEKEPKPTSSLVEH